MKKTPTAALRFFHERYPGRVYSAREISQVLQDYRDAAGRGVNYRRFLGALLESGVSEVEINPEDVSGSKAYRPFLRYIRPDATAYDVAASLKPGGYVSHGAAAVLHHLYEHSDAIYWNKEQSPKPEPAGGLTQQGIDRAFGSHARQSKYIFAFGGKRIVLLNGKNTGDYEVEEHESGVRTATLHRTLFDIAVRPIYAGGPKSVLDAYRAARTRINLRKLLQIIKHIGHIYPFHQAIGFYLSSSGFKSSELAGFRNLGLKYRFYLANKMRKPEFDEEWKVYFPHDLIHEHTARGATAARAVSRRR